MAKDSYEDAIAGLSKLLRYFNDFQITISVFFSPLFPRPDKTKPPSVVTSFAVITNSCPSLSFCRFLFDHDALSLSGSCRCCHVGPLP